MVTFPRGRPKVVGMGRERWYRNKSFVQVAYGVIALLVLAAIVSVFFEQIIPTLAGVILALLAAGLIYLVTARSYDERIEKQFAANRELRHDFAQRKRQMHLETMEMIEAFSRRSARSRSMIEQLQREISELTTSPLLAAQRHFNADSASATALDDGQVMVRARRAAVIDDTISTVTTTDDRDGAPTIHDGLAVIPDADTVTNLAVAESQDRVRDEDRIVATADVESAPPASLSEAKLFAQVGALMRDNARICARNLVLQREIDEIKDRLVAAQAGAVIAAPRTPEPEASRDDVVSVDTDDRGRVVIPESAAKRGEGADVISLVRIVGD